MSDISTEEAYLLQVLQQLRLSYERAAHPYIDRLTSIRATLPTPPIVIAIEQARQLGLLPDAARTEGDK